MFLYPSMDSHKDTGHERKHWYKHNILECNALYTSSKDEGYDDIKHNTLHSMHLYSGLHMQINSPVQNAASL